MPWLSFNETMLYVNTCATATDGTLAAHPIDSMTESTNVYQNQTWRQERKTSIFTKIQE